MCLERGAILNISVSNIDTAQAKSDVACRSTAAVLEAERYDRAFHDHFMESE